jgi:hypothetical protein
MSTWNCPNCQAISSDLTYTKTNAGHSKTRICKACDAELYFESLPDGSFHISQKHRKPTKNLIKSFFGALGLFSIFIGFSLSNGLWALIGCVLIFVWIQYPNRVK